MGLHFPGKLVGGAAGTNNVSTGRGWVAMPWPANNGIADGRASGTGIMNSPKDGIINQVLEVCISKFQKSVNSLVELVTGEVFLGRGKITK